jgi:hypothetical protein
MMRGMTRLPRSGSTFAAPYERSEFSDWVFQTQFGRCLFRFPPETTLDEIVRDLGLVPFAPDIESDLRHDLGLIIGAWMDEYARSLNSGGPQVEDVVKILRNLAWALEMAALRPVDPLRKLGLRTIERMLSGAENGFHDALEIAVACTLTNFVARERADPCGPTLPRKATARRSRG